MKVTRTRIGTDAMPARQGRWYFWLDGRIIGYADLNTEDTGKQWILYATDSPEREPEFVITSNSLPRGGEEMAAELAFARA